MKINNVEIEFDFFDSDSLKRIEDELEIIKKESSKIQKETMPTSQVVFKECKIIKTFFDNVLGEGCAYKIFGDKNSLVDCIKALENMVEAKLNAQNEISTLSEKYSTNRAKRRTKK